MEAPFKSPRPPAPRVRSRGASVSRTAAKAQRDQDQVFDVEDGEDRQIYSTEGSIKTQKLTSSSLLAKLEGLLVAKSNEIQLAGRLGEALLQQQAELESKISSLEKEVQDEKHSSKHAFIGDSDSEDVVSEEVRQKLQALESELKSWDKGNNEIYKVIAPSDEGAGANGLARQPSSASLSRSRPSTPPPPLPSIPVHTSDGTFASPAIPGESSHPTSPSASRRQRNAQHRAQDIEFATEIGQSLLVEVRRLQALLSERDAQLAASKAEKDGMERSMESLASGLKSVEESLDKYREENWNLEVQNQEIRTSLTDVTTNLTKLESERARLIKELSTTRETLDTQKLDNEKLSSQYESLLGKHETDMANMRRTNAGLQREKVDLQALVDSTKNELALRNRGIRRSASAASGVNILGDDSHASSILHRDGDDEEEDVFGANRRGTLGGRRKTGENIPDSPGMYLEEDSLLDSPAGTLPSINESERLKATLAHAQKSIQSLKATLAKEREAKLQLKRRLVESGAVKGEELVDSDPELSDDDEVDENQPDKRRKTITTNRRGRGRGGRGILAARRGSLVGRMPRGTLPSRLSASMDSAGSESDDVQESSLLEHDVSLNSEQEELVSEFDHHDERDQLRASQSSMAGMDPAFADIGNSLPQSVSSTTVVAGTGRQASLGSLMQNNRPNSAMFSSDWNLADQLQQQQNIVPTKDMKDFGTMTDEEVIPSKQIRHFGISTDPESIQPKEIKEFGTMTLHEEPIAVVAPIPDVPKVDTQDIAMQTDSTVGAGRMVSVQTEAEPSVQSKDILTQTEPEPELKSNDISMQTDEVVIPSATAATMTDAERKPEYKEFSTMTDTNSHELATQTKFVGSESASRDVHSLSPLGDTSMVSSSHSDDTNTTLFLSGMSSQAPQDESATPRLESTPTFPERPLPREESLENIRPPSISDSNADDTDIAPSFKSFQRTATDYDTATETEGDFEDARETLATFGNSDFMSMANASQSTVLRSHIDSDQESDFGLNVQATPRFPGRRRREVDPSKETRETGTSPLPEEKQLTHVPEVLKPVLVDASMQTDAPPSQIQQVPIPTHIVTSPSLPTVPQEAEAISSGLDDKRGSVATFGVQGETAQRLSDPPSDESARLDGPIYVQKAELQPVPSSSVDDYTASDRMPSDDTPALSTKPTRAPRLSIPPPPTSAPPKELYKTPQTPTYRPPRPQSPPPADLLQRAQTPTFLAPASISRKRSSTSEAGSVSGSKAGGVGSMPLHRNENFYGASPAPLPHHRPQPRSVASATQLRNAPPIRTQGTSADTPTTGEFGRTITMTPVNQKRPSSRIESTKKRRDTGTISRASFSSSRSGHSRNLSIASSRTSELGGDGLPQSGDGHVRALTNSSTDPVIIHAITQTMIGEFLFKYTRSAFTNQTSEKRHQRFFWIHPYTKTLYWSTSDPGAAGVNQSKAKSVYIAGVRTETDTNPHPPGLYQRSIIVHTVGREIKLTAPTEERHQMWMTAINYLLARPETHSNSNPNTPRSSKISLTKSVGRSPSSFRFRQKLDPTTLSQAAGSTSQDATVVPRNRGPAGAGANLGLYQQNLQSESRLTPKPSTSSRTRGKKSSTGASLHKRPETPAADYQNYIAEFGSPRSVRSYVGPHPGVDESLEVIDRRDVLGADGDNADIGYEGVENVRACCNGEHDVGRLSVSRNHRHHHHHHHGNAFEKQSQASRTNSVSSKSSRLSMNRLKSASSTSETQPPLPPISTLHSSTSTTATPSNNAGLHGAPRMYLTEDPGSPSLRANTLNSTMRGRNTVSASALFPLSPTTTSSQSTTSAKALGSSSAKGRGTTGNVFRSTSPLPTVDSAATVTGK